MPSDMMLCVISYWVLSGAPQAADSAAKLLHNPTKLLKWRDVYLKLTRHNGRAGKHGTYNPKHNDRSFNLSNSEHIDPERAKGNIYWDCFHGFRSALAPQDPDDLAVTFSEVERQFYESRYSNFVESQNERNAKIRHTERNRSIPDLLSSRKTCPEETMPICTVLPGQIFRTASRLCTRFCTRKTVPLRSRATHTTLESTILRWKLPSGASSRTLIFLCATFPMCPMMPM